MDVRPATPAALVALVVSRIAALPGPARVGIDGAPAAGPAGWAGTLVDPLRVLGCGVVVVSTMDFLRPASLRYERGRTDPSAYYEDWVDEAALRREVLDRVGTGEVLPSLWDASVDRATRAPYVPVPPRSAVLVAGPFLLGGGLPFDLTVHVALSAGALARRTPVEDRWTLPAFARYEAEVSPGSLADIVIRLDDPRHPAVVVRKLP